MPETPALYRPAEHEPLLEAEWDEERVRAAIRAIVADAEAAFDGAFWPWHPRDGDDARTGLYEGAAGAIWALCELGSTGWRDAAVALIDRWRERPDLPEHAAATGYWMGEAGIALLAFRLSGDPGVADRLHELVLANLDSRANDVMWGTPGSLLLAEAMLAATGERRWDEAWRAAADSVLAARDEDGLWTQTLYGRTWRFVGAGHGVAGILRALANRGEAPPADLSLHVLRDGPLANWLPTPPSGPDQMRVQWCHGAPGMVACCGELMELDLAVAGGELTWRAGPLAKGPGLCHGTAGNGYAFLRLLTLTGDERWLERARAFGLHAIAQVEAARAELGRGRYSLFTGDLGVALYLRDVLERRDRFPTMGPFA